mgnify:CR=1 FL=1
MRPAGRYHPRIMLPDSLQQLNERLGIGSALVFETGQGGLVRAAMRSPAADAHVYLHGAHVTHYHPRGTAPVLFMSARSAFESGKPIRGGVPVIFPWFGPRKDDPSSPMHGLARLTGWSPAASRQLDNGAVELSLQLASGPETRRLWPHDFCLRYIVRVGSALEMALEVANTSSRDFSFEEALHTYFAVGDVRQVQVRGLEGCDYLDKTDNFARKNQGDAPVNISAETDRVYLDTASACTIDDPALSRRIVIEKSGSGNSVVWNPWVAKAKAMPDFGDDEWPGMICVETCNVGPSAVQLPAGRTHRMSASIRVGQM